MVLAFATALCAAASLLAASCDNTFEPIEPGAPPFSIFGYLDASADTQWIRVNSLRSTLMPSPDPTAIGVTLQEPGTGATLVLRDSTVPFGSMLGPNTARAHDFWTTERIEPGASYRFRAEREDGAVSETVVRIPREYGLEVWVWQRMTTDDRWTPGYNPPYLWIAGLKQVAFLISSTSYFDGCKTAGLARHADAQPPGGDSTARMMRVGAMPTTAEPTPACGLRWSTRREMEVVGSEDEWPFRLDWSTVRLGLAPGNLTSTLSNSLGFLGGVLTKRVPIERCEFAYPSATERYCKLRYDSTTATLRGTLSSACAIPSDTIVVIQLRELEATPPGPPRIRWANHPDRSGSFEIGGLRPGIPHELIAFAGDTSNLTHPRSYEVHRDTLSFTAAQRMNVHVSLEHFGPCLR